jgi:ATP/maltotriose-dependent transcriptional regulator MalT
VRTHIAHIYKKLGVHSREDAMQRAEELGLL